MTETSDYDRHDYSRYAQGARDPAARAANTAYKAGRRAAASEAAGRGTATGEDARNTTISVRIYGEPGSVVFKLSDRETAELTRQASQKGLTPGEYAKDMIERDASALSGQAKATGTSRGLYARRVLLKALGITDTARRAAPRKPKDRTKGKD